MFTENESRERQIFTWVVFLVATAYYIFTALLTRDFLAGYKFQVASLSLVFGGLLMAHKKSEMIKGFEGRMLGFLIFVCSGLMFIGIFLSYFLGIGIFGIVFFGAGLGLFVSLFARILLSGNSRCFVKAFFSNK